MSDLNSYTATGRLAAAPEVRYAASGTAIWSARLAVGYGYGENKGTNWISIKAFGKQAESLGKLGLDKGSAIGVTGELQVREFDRKGGTKGTSVEVNATSVALLGPKPEGGERSVRGGGPVRPQPATGPTGGDDPIPDDDIPFASNRSVW